MNEVLNRRQENYQNIGTLTKILDCDGNSEISCQSFLFHLEPGEGDGVSDDTSKQDGNVCRFKETYNLVVHPLQILVIHIGLMSQYGLQHSHNRKELQKKPVHISFRGH
jgi:hypothetical protein